MDLGYLKIKIDIKAEYEEYKKKYEYKRKELKKEEIKKIFEGFKDFFKADGNFKFKETDHSLTAEYKEYGITLDMDIYKNTDSPGFEISGMIKTYEKEEFDFVVMGIADKPMQEAPYIDEQERMIHETKLFKDFLNGEIVFTFRYSIKGKDETYGTMQELMLSI